MYRNTSVTSRSQTPVRLVKSPKSPVQLQTIDRFGDFGIPENTEIGDIVVVYTGNSDDMYIITDILKDNIKAIGRFSRIDLRYNNGVWYEDTEEMIYEVGIEFFGPPNITHEDIRRSIIDQLTELESSDLPLKRYIVTSPERSVVTFSREDTELPFMIETKTLSGAIVAWLEWRISHVDGITDWKDYVSVLNFIGVDPEVWPGTLEIALGLYFREIKIREMLSFPSLSYSKSARKR